MLNACHVIFVRKEPYQPQLLNGAPRCEDGLCNECLEHHGVSRSTARHHIIPIENYQ